jgi:hypothetical protein
MFPAVSTDQLPGAVYQKYFDNVATERNLIVRQICFFEGAIPVLECRPYVESGFSVSLNEAAMFSCPNAKG